MKTKQGISKKVISFISKAKKEPKWMLKKRLEAFKIFQKMDMPAWGPNLSKLDLNSITYFVRPDAQQSADWKNVPEEIRKTFEKLGIPEAERHALGGAGAMYESEAVYHNLKKEWEKKGVIFLDMDKALKKHTKLVKKYFGACLPPALHKFMALHYAVWSGGTFLYVPKNVKITFPMQAYFRMNTETLGQFEHTIIIAEPGSSVHYVEGCSAPMHREYSLHAGCVEVFVKENARVRYSSVENWSKNMFNLNTKRALVDKNGTIEWVGGNLGSRITMLYPCSVLRGEGAHAEHTSIAFAGTGQNQDTGAQVRHLAKNTSSKIVSKSIAKSGGVTGFRGLIEIVEGAKNCRAHMRCDSLLLDKKSKSETYPALKINEKDVDVGHEATVGRIDREKLFYLMSRGFGEDDAIRLIVNGFIEPVIKQLPLEYAVEMNRLIDLEIGDNKKRIR